MLWAVIMAGGQGTRFWPESRRAKPKQVLKLFGSKTLLEETLERIQTLIPADRVLIVTQEDKIALARKIAGRSVQVIGEPVGRNTAPCLILAAAWIMKKDPEAVIAVLPSDHLITNKKIFRKALTAAARAAEAKRLPVTFGIRPGYAATGYGYLEMKRESERIAGFSLHPLKRFHEKPALKTAQRFVKAGNFLWNSGMFVWKAREVLNAASLYLPETYALALKIVKGGLQKNMRSHFKRMPAISIDYGLMEKMTGRILCIPVDFGWSDVGSWKAIADLLPRDKGGNAVSGEIILYRSSNNFIKSGERLIACVGVRDLIIVDSVDSLLICGKDESENIRSVIEELERRGRKDLL